MIGLSCQDRQCLYESINLCKQFFPGQPVSQTEAGEIRAEVFLVSQTAEEIAVRVQISGDKGHFESTQKALHSFYLGAPDLDLALGKAFCHAATAYTGYHPPWGILTGVRPVKLMKGLMTEAGLQEAERLFCEEFYVSPEKTALCAQAALCETEAIATPQANDCSLYISIPFCPTRCSYCSFVSQENDKAGSALVAEYLELLCREIALTGQVISQLGQKIKTVYIGGGTPAVLSPPQIEQLLAAVRMLGTDFEEFTFEAGRPDVITGEKLAVLKAFDVGRIAINPQTLNDKVLEKIGRRHTVAEFYAAYELASRMGFDHINTDLIAGLPGDTAAGFCQTVDRILALGPAGITIHSFYKKRSSRIALEGQADEWITAGDNGGASYAYRQLQQHGYRPYYLYRQRDTAGGSENIGWGRANTVGAYNIYMMNELHTVYGCGAGSVTRLMRQDGEIQRIYNFKLPLEYIKGYDRMEERKRGVKNFYGR